jgi:hypothetical protein
LNAVQNPTNKLSKFEKREVEMTKREEVFSIPSMVIGRERALLLIRALSHVLLDFESMIA